MSHPASTTRNLALANIPNQASSVSNSSKAHTHDTNSLSTIVKSSVGLLSRSDSLSDMPLQVFSVFPELPLELRRKIWVRSLPGCRLLGSEESDPTPGLNPVALFVCRESRKETLRYYTEWTIEGKSKFYVDTEVDAYSYDIGFYPFHFAEVKASDWSRCKRLAFLIPNCGLIFSFWMSTLANNLESTSQALFKKYGLRLQFKEVIIVLERQMLESVTQIPPSTPANTSSTAANPSIKVDLDQIIGIISNWSKQSSEVAKLEPIQFKFAVRVDVHGMEDPLHPTLPLSLKEVKEPAKPESGAWVLTFPSSF